MKRKIKANLYYVTDIALVATLVLLILAIVKKSNLVPFVSTLIFAGMVLILQAVCGKAKVTNNSGKPIYVKPEDGSEPLVVKPGTEQYDIDGIKADGKVYKATDGTHIVVNADGTVTTKSLTGKFTNFVRGGYLSTLPDDGWKPLFNAGEPKDKSTL